MIGTPRLSQPRTGHLACVPSRGPLLRSPPFVQLVKVLTEMKRTPLVALLTASVLAVPVGFFAGVGSASSSSSASSTRITVAASEFKFVLSKKTVPRGTVTFVVKNKGNVAHNFKIHGKKTPLITPGASKTLKVVFGKGKYPYVCTVPGHAAAGMKGVLTVK